MTTGNGIKLYINDRLQDLDLDEALARLSEQRREQALRFRFEQGAGPAPLPTCCSAKDCATTMG